MVIRSKSDITGESNDEMLFIVDEDDNVIRQDWKTAIHKKQAWHRQAYLFIVNHKREVLLQQRSLECCFDPGLWTASVSGHVLSSETYSQAIHREAQEELGLRINEMEYVGKVLAYSLGHHGKCGGPSAVFVTQREIDISLLAMQHEEVSDVLWIPINSLKKRLPLSATLGYDLNVSQDFDSVFQLLCEFLA